MLVFYRGLHCPICKPYLRDLDRKRGDFAELGITAVALSSDSLERAEQAKADWGIDGLTIGYGLSIDAARQWGLSGDRVRLDMSPYDLTKGRITYRL